MSESLEFFVRYLEQSERSPFTVRSYRGDLQAFAAWFEATNGDPLTPAKITPTDLREYKRHLLNRRLKPASINRQLATLKVFLQWASDAGLAPALPAASIPRAERQVRPGPRWLDRREQNALLRAVEAGGKIRDQAIVKLLLNTGLRVQELCALTWWDVSLSERKGAVTVREGKGSKQRTVPLNAEAREALKALGYEKHAGADAPIFLGQRGALTPRGVQSLLSTYLNKNVAATGLEQLSPHLLRHTFCKNLVDTGVSLEKVAALAGHESLETTRRYVEPSLKDLERAVELIGEREG